MSPDQQCNSVIEKIRAPHACVPSLRRRRCLGPCAWKNGATVEGPACDFTSSLYSGTQSICCFFGPVVSSFQIFAARRMSARQKPALQIAIGAYLLYRQKMG